MPRAVVVIAVFAALLAIPLPASAAGSCAEAGSDPTAAQYCSTPTVPRGESEVKAVSESSAESESEAESESQGAAGASGESGSGSGGGSEGAAATSGSLPFTGADLLVLAAMAAALLAIGVALRRMSRAAPEAR
jgi:hypothetical protein